MKLSVRIDVFFLLPLALGISGSVRSFAKPPTVDPFYGLPTPALKQSTATPIAHWIWTAHTAGTQTVLARHSIALLQKPHTAVLSISADDCFTLYINGRQAASSRPNVELGWKHVQNVDVTGLLTTGANEIGISGFNNGGAAGIVTLLSIDGRAVVQTDTTWKVLEVDLPPSGWDNVGFDDSSWKPATALAPVGQGPWTNGLDNWPGQDSSVWYLAHRPAYPTAITVVSGANYIIGELSLVGSQHGRLEVAPMPVGAKASILVDFGFERAGRLELQGTDGAKIVVTTGESREECSHDEPALDNHGPTQLTLSSHAFSTTPYSAFRWALITFSGAQHTTLTRLVFDQKYYPVTYKGSFDCSDPILTRAWYTGAYTAHLCMQEDIWDAPKRDRGLWCGDLQVTGQTINDAFGDTFLMEQSIHKLRQIAQAGKPDNALPNSEINDLPGYSAAWFCELADFHRHIGDLAFLRSQHDLIISLLEFQKTDFNAQNLFINPRKNWAFCDWAPGFVIDTPPTLSTTDLYIIKGVHEAVYLLHELGDEAAAKKYQAWADELTDAARRTFVDSSGLTYGDRLQQNAMAVYSGVATPPQEAAIFKNILSTASPTWRPTTPLKGVNDEVMSPYYGYFVLSDYGFLGHNQDGINLIRSYWGEMLKRGSTTWLEMFDLRFPKDFGAVLNMTPYISQCHGWSSGPTSYLTERILGVRPTSSGFNTTRIAPHLEDLKWAEGDVPTPHGILHVRASRKGALTLLDLTLPAGIDAEIVLSGATAFANGLHVAADGTGNGNLTFHVIHAGRYHVVAKP